MTVLVGELASQFSVIQHQIDDPFLVRIVCLCVCMRSWMLILCDSVVLGECIYHFRCVCVCM